MDAPTPFFCHPLPAKRRICVQAYYRKRLPKEDRAEQLRLTVIASIDNKLKRMDFDELREVLEAATQVMERKKSL